MGLLKLQSGLQLTGTTTRSFKHHIIRTWLQENDVISIGITTGEHLGIEATGLTDEEEPTISDDGDVGLNIHLNTEGSVEPRSLIDEDIVGITLESKIIAPSNQLYCRRHTGLEDVEIFTAIDDTITRS
tara:strand:- start:327 stop:713 length:387 start_codon:yes stop_codon:yes gene_type:complete